MKILNSKSGMTLVEIILSVLILGIAAVSLAVCFSSVASIFNRATLLKNASAATSTAVELLDDTREVKDEDVDVDFDSSIITQEPVGSSYKINFVGYHYTKYYSKDASGKVTENMNDKTEIPLSCNVTGTYVVAVDKGNGQSGVKYKEYLPNDFSFTVDASEEE